MPTSSAQGDIMQAKWGTAGIIRPGGLLFADSHHVKLKRKGDARTVLRWDNCPSRLTLVYRSLTF
jgi:hypothetical protein